MNLSMLDDILDPQGHTPDEILNWVNERIAAIRDTAFTPEITSTFESLEFQEDIKHPLGPESSATWRRFFMATLLADWASYDHQVDRADFSRLKYIMATAYRYTRLWFCRLSDGKYTPVGYSAWYPIQKFVFDSVLAHPESIDDRAVLMPHRSVDKKQIKYAYVFNISVIVELLNTRYSQKVIRAFRRDGQGLEHVPMLAIAVASAGIKFSRVGNFKPAGTFTIQGEQETLFVRDQQNAMSKANIGGVNGKA